MKQTTRKMTVTAMFLAMGLLLPMLFHSIGLGGSFLPMFWPTAAGAFFLSVPHALLLGLLTPLFSSLMTGMPSFSPPIVYMVMAELFTLNLIIGLLHDRTQWGVFWILFAGLLTSRFALVLIAGLVASWFGLPARLFSIATVVQSLPGILLMLAIIPILVSRIKKERLFQRR